MKKTRVSVINGVAKRAALGAMLFSSVVMFATTPNRNTRIENPPQTEVVSKDGADALKAMTFPQQQNPAVPTVHNKALDEKFLKFYDTEQEKQEVMKLLSNNYNKYGSYLGGAIIQQYIDLNMFLEFLDGNIDILKRFDEEAYNKIDRDAMQKVVEKGGPIKQWLNENYFNVYNQPFGQFDHMPDYEELNDALDDFIEKDPYKLFENGLLLCKYDTKIANEILEKNNMDNVQKKITLMAVKIHAANKTLFNNLMEACDLFKESDGNNIFENFRNFMNAVTLVKYY